MLSQIISNNHTAHNDEMLGFNDIKSCHKQCDNTCISKKGNEWVDNEKKDTIDIEDVENQDNDKGEEEEERLLPECDGLWYMGQSKKHKQY